MIDLAADKRKEICEINVERGDRVIEFDQPEVLAVINVPDPAGGADYRSRNIVVFKDTGYDAYALYRIDPNMHYGARDAEDSFIAGNHLDNKADFIKIGDRPTLVLGSLDTRAQVGAPEYDSMVLGQPFVGDGTTQPSIYDNFESAPAFFSPHYAYVLDTS